LGDLFRRHGQQVQDVAYRIVRSTDDAEDITQDVFVGLPEALRAYEATGPFETWLRKLVARTALLRLRRERRRTKWHQRAAEQQPRRTRPDAVEARLTLERALRRMPDDQRVVYVLKEMEGYAHGEIADLLGISAGASEVRLHRARRFLRDRLGDSI
jgi:RNA polymerase sigma-70 factor (ECF subfamily)